MNNLMTMNILAKTFKISYNKRIYLVFDFKEKRKQKTVRLQVWRDLSLAFYDMISLSFENEQSRNIGNCFHWPVLIYEGKKQSAAYVIR